MPKMIPQAALLVLSSLTSVLLAQSATLIHCGTLIAVPGETPINNASVLVVDGIIESVQKGFTDSDSLTNYDSVELIDLSDQYVMPGLIDCHTHITGQYSKDVRLRSVTETDADSAIKATVYAKRTVQAGFTTIRNVGSSGDAAFAIRDAINTGTVIGPRILVAGESISPTGGHSDGTHGYREDLMEVPSEYQGIADGVDSCRQAVRAQIKRGADVIKLTATGGVLSNTKAGVEQQFFNDELNAIIETAHLLGRKVAAHAHGSTGINAALRAGVDSIEHGTYLNDESIELFIESGAYLVPTIHAGKFVEHKAAEDGYFPPAIRSKAAMVGPQIQDSTRRAYEAGVKIAFGTDVGVGEHGTNAMEFIYMRDAGISPVDCLISATIHAADLCDLNEVAGTIEAGKSADIIATQNNPLEDITELLSINFVMARGMKID
ncbi:MAG: amidohydrolase family protein [Phycisphaerales bacterium]